MPAPLARDCALPDAEVMMLAWPSTLKGDLLGKRLFARVSARMARCLALMPAFRWRACLVEALCEIACVPSCLHGPIADLGALFLGLGRSPA